MLNNDIKNLSVEPLKTPLYSNEKRMTMENYTASFRILRNIFQNGQITALVENAQSTYITISKYFFLIEYLLSFNLNIQTLFFLFFSGNCR